MAASPLSVTEDNNFFWIIYNEAKDPILLTQDGRFLDCNRAALTQLGIRDKAELPQLTLTLLAPPFQPDGHTSAEKREEISKLLKHAPAGYHHRFEWVIKRMDGSLFDAEITSTVIIINGESVVHSLLRDITEQKRVANELRESQGAARKIFEEAADPVILYKQGVAIDCNKAALQQLGYRHKQDFLGLSPANISPPLQKNGQSSESYAAELIRTAQRNRSNNFEWQLQRTDGSIIDADVTLTAITVYGEEVLHIHWHNTSEQKRLSNELRESAESFQRIFNEASAPLILLERNAAIFEANQAAVRLFGYPDKMALIGKTPLEMALPCQADGRNSVQAGQEFIAHALQQGVHHFEWQMQRMDGSVIDTEVTLTAIKEQGKTLIHAQIRDLTEQNRLRAALYAEKERAEITLASIGDAVLTTDAEGRVTFLNHVASQLTGWDIDEAIGQPTAKVFHIVNETTRARVLSPVDEVLKNGKTVNLANHTVLIARDGKEYNIEDSAAPIFLRDGSLLGCVLVFHDVSEKHQLLQSVRWQAGHDVLTGLPNRVLLADRFARALTNANRQNNLLGVCLMDLDQFKPVNDLYGHNMGDRLLIDVTSRLNQVVRGEDTVARLGGDEFVLLLGGLADHQQLELVLRRILEAISAPYVIDGHMISISASIGVAIYPQDEADADTLLRHADQAMYLAKQAGRNRFHWFDIAHDRQAQTSQQMLTRLREALRTDELCLHYQPKVNMRSGEVIGMEALLRWQHPQQGLLPPLDFLPLAEQTDLIIEIGEWVIEKTLQQIAAWSAAGKSWPVSVNIAARHFQLPDFLDRLKAILARYPDVPPQQLEIEILESVALGDMNHVQQLILACQALGIEFSLDDFGTGYSSLSYLKRLPADTLKIDQSFVRDMLDDKDDLALIEAIIGLTSAFNRKVVAEGVETVEHGVLLMRLGCDIAQGYGIAHPMSAVQVIDWADRFTPDPKWRQWAGIQWDMCDFPLLVAEHDHHTWVKHVLKIVAEDALLSPNHGQLISNYLHRFGYWYESEGKRRYGQLAEFIAIKPIHTQIHRTGEEIIRLHEAGHADALHALCTTLLILKNQLVESLNSLQQIVTQMQTANFSLSHEGIETY